MHNLPNLLEFWSEQYSSRCICMLTCTLTIYTWPCNTSSLYSISIVKEKINIYLVFFFFFCVCGLWCTASQHLSHAVYLRLWLESHCGLFIWSWVCLFLLLLKFLAVYQADGTGKYRHTQVSTHTQSSSSKNKLPTEAPDMTTVSELKPENSLKPTAWLLFQSIVNKALVSLKEFWDQWPLPSTTAPSIIFTSRTFVCCPHKSQPLTFPHLSCTVKSPQVYVWCCFVKELFLICNISSFEAKFS